MMKATLTKRRQVVMRVWMHAHVRVFVVWSDSLFDSTRICVELGLKGLESGSHTGGNKSFSALQFSQHAGWRREALPEMCVLLEVYR